MEINFPCEKYKRLHTPKTPTCKLRSMYLCISRCISRGEFSPSVGEFSEQIKERLERTKLSIQGVFWRRRRDLNPRAGFPTYTLSRGGGFPLFNGFPFGHVSVAVSMGGHAKPKSVRFILQTGTPLYQNTIPSIACASRNILTASKFLPTLRSFTP